MVGFLRKLWRRSPLGRMLEQRRRRDEHRHQLERTRRSAEEAHREAQIWLRSCGPDLQAAATTRLMALDAEWQRANTPDDLERTAELGRLEAAFRDVGALMLALSRLERAAEHPRRWVQELLAAGDDLRPARKPTRPQQRNAAARAPDPLKLAQFAERLESLERRYQALVAELPTAEPGDLLGRLIDPLERGFRQLANETYRPWATRFPERAKAAGDEAFAQMQRILRRDGPSAPARAAPVQARSYGQIELGEADSGAHEAGE